MEMRVGCVRAMMDVLVSLGKRVRPLLLSPPAIWYAAMFEQKVSYWAMILHRLK